MPRLSLKNIVLRAVEPAVEDRLSLSQCWPSDSQERQEATEQARAVQELRRTLAGLKGSLDGIGAEDADLCFAALVWAEQHEQGLVDSYKGKGEAARRAKADAHLFRTARLQHFGKSVFEARTDSLKAVSIFEVVRTAGAALEPGNQP